MPYLPRSKKALSIATFERSLSDKGSGCDLRRLTFIDAYGLVGTACALRSSSETKVVVPAAPTTRLHLSSMGFHDFLTRLGIRSGLPDVHSMVAPDVVVPLQSAADTGGAQSLSNLLWEQLEDRVAPQVLHAIAEGVWEMVANALEHSGTDALIMGQVYRSPRGVPPDHDDRVQVVIGDTGRGIRDSLLATGVHTPDDDVEAIAMSLRYLVSSVIDDPGRGQGLFTTMEQVLKWMGAWSFVVGPRECRSANRDGSTKWCRSYRESSLGSVSLSILATND